MKKYLLILLLIGLFTLTGCASKKALSVEEVKSKVEGIGFKVTDNKDNFSDMEHVLNALKIGDSNFQIEFFEISDLEKTKIIFLNNKEILDGNRNGTYKNKSTSGKNYETYELISNGYYMYISRIDNTMLFASNKIEYEQEVKQIIKELKY